MRETQSEMTARARATFIPVEGLSALSDATNQSYSRSKLCSYIGVIGYTYRRGEMKSYRLRLAGTDRRLPYYLLLVLPDM